MPLCAKKIRGWCRVILPTNPIVGIPLKMLGSFRTARFLFDGVSVALRRGTWQINGDGRKPKTHYTGMRNLGMSVIRG